MAREIVIGIDVGTSAVKTIVAEKRKDEDFPYILGANITPVQGLRRGCVINPHDVAAAIKTSARKAQENSGVNIQKAFISMGGMGIEGIRSKGSIVVSRADHEITEGDLKRAVSQSEAQMGRSSSSYLLNREILHIFPIAYKVDDESIIGNPVGTKGEKLEVETLFITAPSSHLNNLVKSMEIAGISVEDIIADSWATSHLLLGEKEKEVGCLLVNIGGDTSSIMLFEEGGPISLEVFPIGSNHITYDIARAFQILLHEAEEMKLAYGKDPALKKKLNGVIEPRLNDIFELAENHLVKIKRAKLLPAGIILTGGGTNLEGITESAKKAFRLPAQLIKPEPPSYPVAGLENPAWSVALGLCFMALGEKNPLGSPKWMLGSKAKNSIFRLFKNFLP